MAVGKKNDSCGEYHILFDFDGTLVDSMPYWADAMLCVLDDHKIKYPEDIIRIITPLGTEGTVRYYRGLGLDLPAEQIINEINAHAEPKYLYEIPAKKYVSETLAWLSDMGYHLHVLTASPHRWLDPCLKRLGLFDLFDNVWSCDDFDTEKSNPEIYRAVERKLGINGDESSGNVKNVVQKSESAKLIFLDDNYNALRAAVASGITAVGVFDKSSGDETTIKNIRDIAHGYIHDFSELVNVITTLQEKTL